MNDPIIRVLIDRTAIALRVAELGARLTRELPGTPPLLVPVMDGAMVFAADLMREIRIPLDILPIKASSYGNATASSGIVRLPRGIPEEIAGRNILVIDDILDTGRTLGLLRTELLKGGARSVQTCVLLRKESARHLDADYVGFEIPDRFVVGYGLDLAGRHRNLPDIAIVSGGE